MHHNDEEDSDSLWTKTYVMPKKDNDDSTEDIIIKYEDDTDILFAAKHRTPKKKVHFKYVLL